MKACCRLYIQQKVGVSWTYWLILFYCTWCTYWHGTNVKCVVHYSAFRPGQQINHITWGYENDSPTISVLLRLLLLQSRKPFRLCSDWKIVFKSALLGYNHCCCHFGKKYQVSETTTAVVLGVHDDDDYDITWNYNLERWEVFQLRIHPWTTKKTHQITCNTITIVFMYTW